MDGGHQGLDLTFLLIAGTLLILFLVGSVVAVMLFHQKKMLREQARIQAIEIANQRDITNAILSTQEEERRRIAQDLHDELGSMIFHLKMKIGEMMHTNAELTEEIERNEALIDAIGARIRGISHDMMPPAIRHRDLGKAVKLLASSLNESSGMELEVSDDGLASDLSAETQMTLYRVINEYFNNLIRHSEAKNVTVEMKRTDNVYDISIKDDGTEFDFQYAMIHSSGLGLKGMAGRLSQLAAEYRHVSTENQGNKFCIQLNLDRPL